jgi:hypothetical protein
MLHTFASGVAEGKSPLVLPDGRGCAPSHSSHWSGATVVGSVCCVPLLDVEGPVTAEVFTLARSADELLLTGPCAAAPWHIESGAGEHPIDTVRRIVEGAIDGVLLVHSTSWRYERDAVVLSFVVVIDPDAVGAMDAAPVVRSALARSSTHAAPETIGHLQVLEHGLRHLAWLAKEDAMVRATLDDGWRALLAGYVPEPFRQLDTPQQEGWT